MSLPQKISSVPQTPIWSKVRQSPPIDQSLPWSDTSIKGKHIVITGGASGFGAGFVRQWSALGASIVIGDVNASKGEQLVADIRKETGNTNVHFVKCDVRDWDQQANLFTEAIKLSPHKGIDTVVANAGVAPRDPLVMPSFDGSEPKKPDLNVVDINLNGVLYTAYLALFWLPKNPGSKDIDYRDTTPQERDRSLILIGSWASIAPIAGSPAYAATKHGVTGLFRALRCSAFASGVRVNMVCPYFINTDIIPFAGKAILAGGAWGEVQSVVDAVTRLAADRSIVGRAVAVGPKVKLRQEEDGDWTLIGLTSTGSKKRPRASTKGDEMDGAIETAMWDLYADDFEDSEAATFRIVSLLNAVTAARGVRGIFQDLMSALRSLVKR
jgi:NAD(P)-dependent dehydrogenase (short-subunit alcohol dehydrogenase family)